MTLALRYAARSDIGLLRTGNEDSLYAGPRLLAVADGMGGHAAGEVASAVAIAALAPLDQDVPSGDLLGALQRAAQSANRHLREMMAGDAGLDGMGTTLVAVLFAGTRLGLLHVGDSRCYLLRDGELLQITHDHTLVQTLVDRGEISEEEAGHHPQRSIITQALDGREDVALDLSVREARVGDRYLLCSDGLTGPVGSPDTLRDALQITAPQKAVDHLVALALRGGGPDNVTVIVADIVEGHDVGTDTPVVAGAAAEQPQQPPPGVADSAAARARTAEGRHVPPPPATPSGPQQPPRARARRPRRTAMLVGALAVLLIGVTLVAVNVLRGQYFVGIDRDQVAVFRGVGGQVAGVRLSSVEERSGIMAATLPTANEEKLRRGIPAMDRGHAGEIVGRLRELACPSSGPEPTGLPEEATARPAEGETACPT